jgi:hypothetical protein
VSSKQKLEVFGSITRCLLHDKDRVENNASNDYIIIIIIIIIAPI